MNIVVGAVSTTTALVATSLALRGYRQALHPLYANVPTELYLPHILYGTLALAAFIPRPPKYLALAAVGAFLCAMPHLVYWAASYTSRMHDPVKGPLITHVLCIAPLGYLVSCMTPRPASKTLAPIVGALVMPALMLLEQADIWSFVPLPTIIQDNILLSIGSVALTFGALMPQYIAATAKPAGPKRRTPKELDMSAQLYNTLGLLLVGTAIPRLAWEFRPTLRTPLEGPYLYPKADPFVRVLSSTHSITGQIVVAEALRPSSARLAELGPQYMHSLRFLRADHSMLGGVWVGERVATMGDKSGVARDDMGEPLGDSIYSTFVLQEAARLVDSTDIGKEGSWENALIIGLGIGVSASAFQRHNISTTIVEIDPAVYHAAREYFALVDPGSDKVFLEDARGWVSRKKETLAVEESMGAPKAAPFDIVVHDCFSGGGVPAHIFTVEFWRDLKTLINPEGVLAVNFAGKIDSDPSRAILLTLESVFGHCRVFHDRPDLLTPEQMREEFLNMVMFCTSSPRGISFREPKTSDYLDSYLRQHVLSSFTQNEIDPTFIRGEAVAAIPEEEAHFILTDANNPLGSWQDAEAMDHWKVMRQVLPDTFWEIY